MEDTLIGSVTLIEEFDCDGVIPGYSRAKIGIHVVIPTPLEDLTAERILLLSRSLAPVIRAECQADLNAIAAQVGGKQPFPGIAHPQVDNLADLSATLQDSNDLGAARKRKVPAKKAGRKRP